jgi:hypothetical protein
LAEELAGADVVFFAVVVGFSFEGVVQGDGFSSRGLDLLFEAVSFGFVDLLGPRRTAVGAVRPFLRV